MQNNTEKYKGYRLLVFVLCLAIPFVLYFNRHFDNNRLTSWAWAFDHVSLTHFGFMLLVVLAVAMLLSQAVFYEKHKGLMLFVIAFALAASFWSEPEVIVDAARYFTQAKQLSVYGVGYFAEQWGREVFAWTDLPLIPFLYGLVFKIFGEQRVFIQVVNTLFYSLTVVLTYQLGKDLWDEDLGFWGGLLLLGFPYLYTQVPLLLVDVATMFFFMLAVVMTVKTVAQGGSGRIIIAGLALFCVFYVKYSTWLLLTLMPIISACFLYRSPTRTLRRVSLLALLSFLLIGVFFILYVDVLRPQLNFLVEYQKPGLKRWGESYISTFLFQVHPLITAAAIYAFWAAFRKMDFRFLIISFLLLLFVFMQVKRIRYTIPIFPLVALMAAYGLKETLDRKLAKQVVFSVAATSFIIAFAGFLPFLKTLGVRNLQQAGRFVNTLPLTAVEVVSLAGENAVVNPDTVVPVLDIYTVKNIVYDQKPLGRQTLERAKTSPLRFTWELPLPEYYLPAADKKEAEALVVILDDPGRALPPGLENKIAAFPHQKTFHQSSYIFQHQTFVSVYHK